MAGFRNQGWSTRFESMGDEAEQKFEEWAARNRKGYTRYGLDRPPIQVYKLPARLRHTPDFLTSTHLIECQGLGQDQSFKLKLEKHGALHHWHSVFPVQLYIWDSAKKREAFLGLMEFDSLLGTVGAQLHAFPDNNKAYFAVPADHIFSAGADAPLAA
jgi:hypothetical protein